MVKAIYKKLNAFYSLRFNPQAMVIKLYDLSKEGKKLSKLVKTINKKFNAFYSPRFKPWAMVINLQD